MIESFKKEFFWMLREGKGYFPWVQDAPHQLFRRTSWRFHKRCFMCHESPNARDVVKLLLQETVCENELFDLFFKALVRAEIRFISRYIPQRSHEERLTGNLVAEMDSSIFLIKEEFYKKSIEMYSKPMDIDFFYCDLSRGGKLEKETGADLGIIVEIDLPDFPYTVKSLVLQAKKVNGGRAQLDKIQFETILNYSGDNCAYLFYDMDVGQLCSPLCSSY